MPRGSGGHHRLDTPTTVGHLLARRNTEGAARVGALGLRTVRAVTHLDVDTAGIDRARRSASTKAAMGPLPAPVTVREAPSTTSCAVIRVVSLPSSEISSWLFSSYTGCSGRYCRRNASHMADGLISVPVSSVIAWIV